MWDYHDRFQETEIHLNLSWPRCRCPERARRAAVYLFGSNCSIFLAHCILVETISLGMLRFRAIYYI